MVSVLQRIDLQAIVEPDYLNQCFIAWLKDDCLTSESFLAAIACCTSVSQLDHMEDRLQKVQCVCVCMCVCVYVCVYVCT